MICTIEIDPSLKAYGQEILRRRLIGGEVKSDLRNTLAEIAFLKLYDQEATLDDFRERNKRSLNFITEDKKGCLVRVINRIVAPYRVYSRQLDADVYVFCSTSKDLKTCTFHGWLDIHEIYDSPVHWFEEDGKRTDYCHEVDKMFMYNMPEELDFNLGCSHPFAIWDYFNSAWTCSICDKACYDLETYRRVNAITVSG